MQRTGVPHKKKKTNLPGHFNLITHHTGSKNVHKSQQVILFPRPHFPTERFNYLLIQLKACMVTAIKLSKLTNLFLTGA